MAAVENILSEDDTCQVIEVVSDGWPDKAGSWRSVRTEWKPGHNPDAPSPEVTAAAAVVAAKNDPTQADPSDSTLLSAIATLVAQDPQVQAAINGGGA